MKYIVLLILISCGKIKVETSPVPPIQIGPDFEKAIKICDERYGPNTKNSEDCFLDYRTYLSPKIGINLATITDFCKNTYTNQIDIAGCQADLIAIISGQKQ